MQKKRSFLLYWLALTSVLVVPFLAHSQSPSPQKGGASRETANTLKASTRLVVVDVVAVDRDGAPVADLAIDDFTVSEDGVAQKIAAFGYQRPAGLTATASPFPPNVFSNAPQYRTSSLNVILLDGLNGEFASRAYAREQLLKYLEAHPSIPPTALYGLENKLKLLHGFTTDSKELADAVREFKPQVMNRISTVYATASPFTQHGDVQSNDVSIMNTLSALDLLAQSLAAYAGRKNLVWLSEAFPETLFPDLFPGNSPNAISASRDPGAALPDGAMGVSLTPMQAAQAQSSSGGGTSHVGGAEYAALVRRVAEELASAQVAVYPIDAAGVGKISRVSGLATMRQMAERTGGKTFANQNDLDFSIGRSLEDGAAYYTLAYYPENKIWDGRFRQIQVATTRPGVSLRHRVGYYASDPGAALPENATMKKLSEEFARALAWDAPDATAVLFRATVAPGAGQKTTVSFAIDPHTLKFEETPDGVQHARVSCAVVVYSAKGVPVKEELNNMISKVQADQFQKLMNGSFPCQVTLGLNPGKYVLRVGVTDRASRRMGSTTASVTVP